MRPARKFYALLALCLALAILATWLRPPAVDWSPSFSAADKIPYGSYIVYRLLPHLFPGQEIRAVQEPVFTFLHAPAARDSAAPSGPADAGAAAPVHYLFINTLFMPDPEEARALLDFVAEGNHVFIAAEIIQGSLADTLRLGTARTFIAGGADLTDLEEASPADIAGGDSLWIDFVNPALMSGGYPYRTGAAAGHFTQIDTARATILGVNQRGRVNYIRMPWGDGIFWLNTVPLAFTNYHVLSPRNRAYVEKALSYLPVRPVLWDEYYKIGRQAARTPLRYILQRPPLRWAYGLSLVTVGLFILFEGKRKRRIIPVIPPIPNDTLEFVRTTGRLYYQHRDHKHLAEKKIKFFQEHLRTRYGIDMPDAGVSGWEERAAAKTGRPVEAVRGVYEAIQAVRAAPALSDEALSRFNQQMERFYQHGR